MIKNRIIDKYIYDHILFVEKEQNIVQNNLIQHPVNLKNIIK